MTNAVRRALLHAYKEHGLTPDRDDAGWYWLDKDGRDYLAVKTWSPGYRWPTRRAMLRELCPDSAAMVGRSWPQ